MDMDAFKKRLSDKSSVVDDDHLNHIFDNILSVGALSAMLKDRRSKESMNKVKASVEKATKSSDAQDIIDILSEMIPRVMDDIAIALFGLYQKLYNDGNSISDMRIQMIRFIKRMDDIEKGRKTIAIAAELPESVESREPEHIEPVDAEHDKKDDETTE
jgi:deoxyxylulose-5-phosphate synthase